MKPTITWHNPEQTILIVEHPEYTEHALRSCPHAHPNASVLADITYPYAVIHLVRTPPAADFALRAREFLVAIPSNIRCAVIVPASTPEINALILRSMAVLERVLPLPGLIHVAPTLEIALRLAHSALYDSEDALKGA